MLPDLTVVDYTDASSSARLRTIAAEAERIDGYAPLNEQALFDLAAGTRTAWIATSTGADTARGDSTPGDAPHGDAVPLDTALLVLGDGELDLVVHPEHRRLGVATAILGAVFSEPSIVGAEGVSTAWAHGDHPGARVLAHRYQFEAARTLLQLRLVLTDSHSASVPPTEAQRAQPPGARIEAFRPGHDDVDWVDLNALVFADHPEQGGLTLDDLAARQQEPWFEAGDFLIARDDSGRMVGYNWLKIEENLGEIYVVGVHPGVAGHGLGRALMRAGLARLHERGCRTAALYVEADSLGPVHLYRSLGFTDFTVDVQYRRVADRDPVSEMFTQFG
jgi:mycothiol synthase